jgi:hypothetical protein
MRITNTVLALLGVAVPFSQSAWSQVVAADSAFVAEAAASAVAAYESALHLQEALYNGSQYVPIPEPYDGFPFFGSEYLEEGTIKYAGEVFHNVPMEYDLVHDVLVIEHYDQRGYVTDVMLHSDLVEYFDLLGHRFISVHEDSSGLRPGFYDLLYDGEMKLLCKYKKSVHETVEAGTLNVKFLERVTYYLLRDGQGIPLRSRSSLFKALADKKKALRQYARANRLTDEDKERMFASLIRYYESLN